MSEKNIKLAEIIPGQHTIKIKMLIGRVPAPDFVVLPINVAVAPPIPTFSKHLRKFVSKIALSAIPVKLNQAITGIISKLLKNKIDGFFDDSRELKTLLNFGNDYQSLITNWIVDPSDSSGSSILVKMYQPLPADIEEKTQLWISRELSPSAIDKFYLKYTPAAAPKVYLRPPNKNIQLTGRTGQTVEKQTINKLFSSGAFAPVGQSDRIVEEWFTDDINSVELNIDYSNYSNFIFFGSARGRVEAFVRKLQTIENYSQILNINSTSITQTGAILSSSLSYPALKTISEQRIDLIRSFDGYERFLYYKSSIPYSSSFTNDVDDEFYFHADATYPKINDKVIPVASASLWISKQLEIANAYDRQNQNSLKNTLPKYLSEDVNSSEFTIFTEMIGHQFDILKPYIDQMTNIYDRSNDPALGISPDLIWNIAESYGVELPNQYAINRLVDYTIGETGQVTDTIYRQTAAETWKRLLHNQIFMTKTKGTKTSLRALANSYGILPTTLQIREGVIAGISDADRSFETFEEQTNVLNITSESFVRIPWCSTTSLNANTIELRFATTNNVEQTVLFNADDTWALKVVPATGSYGKLVLVSGSVEAISSSVMPLYTGDFYSVMVRNGVSGVNLQVKLADGDSIIDSSEVYEPATDISSIYNTAEYLNLGGSGSYFGKGFSGQIDEFRVWGELISDDVFDTHVKYPGLYGGNTPHSARDSLLVRLSFNKLKNIGGVDKTVINESPFVKNNTPLLQTFDAVSFLNIPSAPYNMSVGVREVTRFNLNSGASQFTSNQVTIAPPANPVLIAGSSIPVLSSEKSMVSISDKSSRNKSSNVVGFYFSVTDAVNDSIIRSVGNFDLNNLIGDPSDQYKSSYTELLKLNELYWNSYAYSYNVNSFVDFVRNLLEPLFIQAKDLVPVRAKLLSGIVHEPHILERPKIAQKNRPTFSAGNFGRDNDMQNLEANAVTSNPSSIEGNYVAHDVHIDTDKTTSVYGFNDTHDASLDVTEHQYVSADSFGYESSMSIIDELDILGYFAYDDSAIIDITDNMIKAKVSVDSIDSYYMPEIIGPASDFDNVETYTYFTNQDGLVGTETYDYVRLGSSIQNDRGSWQKDAIYKRDDLVEQVDQLGDAIKGNQLEFICITSDMSFKSSIPPYMDRKNWKQAKYKPVIKMILKKAVLIDGKVSIVPISNANPVVNGYRPEHFKFTRDRRRGILNHQWLGCLQTDETTTDGKPAVEVTYTSGDILVVNNGSEPVQQTNPQAGPILDVR